MIREEYGALVRGMQILEDETQHYSNPDGNVPLKPTEIRKVEDGVYVEFREKSTQHDRVISTTIPCPVEFRCSCMVISLKRKNLRLFMRDEIKLRGVRIIWPTLNNREIVIEYAGMGEVMREKFKLDSVIEVHSIIPQPLETQFSMNAAKFEELTYNKFISNSPEEYNSIKKTLRPCDWRKETFGYSKTIDISYLGLTAPPIVRLSVYDPKSRAYVVDDFEVTTKEIKVTVQQKPANLIIDYEILY